MSPRQRGAPAGEVGRDAKACGWSMQLKRQFIGRGSEVDLPGGDKAIVVATKAAREAFFDAAHQAFDYLLEQYEQLRCEAPCHKTWGLTVLKGVPEDLLPMFEAFNLGGVTVEKVNVSKDSTGIGTRYRVSITVECDYTLECTKRAKARKDPEFDKLFAFARLGFEELIRKAEKEG